MHRDHDIIRRQRQTKIVATIGPASASEEMLRKLVLTGVDMFRLNFSHGEQSEHVARVNLLRQLEQELRRPIALMADLQGPKLRVGRFADDRIVLEAGQAFRLDRDTALGDTSRVELPHPEIFEALLPGATLLLDDGKVRLKVENCGSDFADCRVLAGSSLSNRKGVNVPDVVLPLSALTAKDRSDLTCALDAGVDWIAMSFVQRPADLAEGRRLIQGRAALLAKLEKPSAIDHLEELIDHADGIMVARGDLGVEMLPEEVPSLQKRIVRLCRQVGKPVIVATQMLESMISAPTPTRAEASDVATAVYDGADAVMLSAETAAGAYPLEAVAIMDRIARQVERDPLHASILDAQRPEPLHTSSDAITAAANQIAHTVEAAAIVTYTTSGSTTLRAVRERPMVPVLCLTSEIDTARRLQLSYGVHAVVTEDIANFTEMVQKAVYIAYAHGIAEKGQRLVITAGVPFGTPGNTNVVRIAWVEG